MEYSRKHSQQTEIVLNYIIGNRRVYKIRKESVASTMLNQAVKIGTKPQDLRKNTLHKNLVIHYYNVHTPFVNL